MFPCAKRVADQNDLRKTFEEVVTIFANGTSFGLTHLQSEVFHIENLVFLLLALVRDTDGHLRDLDVDKQLVELGSNLHFFHVVFVERRLDVKTAGLCFHLFGLVSGLFVLFIHRACEIVVSHGRRMTLMIGGSGLFREAKGHDPLVKSLSDADRQRHQVNLKVRLDGDSSHRSFFSAMKKTHSQISTDALYAPTWTFLLQGQKAQGCYYYVLRTNHESSYNLKRSPLFSN